MYRSLLLESKTMFYSKKKEKKGMICKRCVHNIEGKKKRKGEKRC